MIDICRSEDSIILNHEVDLIIQQIDILFDTTPGEVLGSPDYGADFERFLFELNLGSETIANYIRNTIYANVELFDWNVEVEVRFMVGELNDIMLVGIRFSQGSESYSHVYKITHSSDESDAIEY